MLARRPGASSLDRSIPAALAAPGETLRASVADLGGNGGSPNASATRADGRFVAFNSAATNLVPGDTNGRFDLFQQPGWRRHEPRER
ncbi:MAG: hypothetical protein DMD48_14655 [Gemmatimonadetes bacterium]|nr:MAG: hypothetical protein DMD48_14655 [Gemmatimonadota bacterium]